MKMLISRTKTRGLLLLLIILFSLSFSACLPKGNSPEFYYPDSASDTQPGGSTDTEVEKVGWDALEDIAGNPVNLEETGAISLVLDYVVVWDSADSEPRKMAAGDAVGINYDETAGQNIISAAYSRYNINYDAESPSLEFSESGYSVANQDGSAMVLSGVLARNILYLNEEDTEGYYEYRFYPYYRDDGKNYPLIKSAQASTDLTISDELSVTVQTAYIMLDYDVSDLFGWDEETVYLNSDVYIDSLDFYLAGDSLDAAYQVGEARVTTPEEGEPVTVKDFETVE